MCSSIAWGDMRAQHTAYREQVCLAFLVKHTVMWKGKCLVLSCVATQEQITARVCLLRDKKTSALRNTVPSLFYSKNGPGVLTLYLPTWSWGVINRLV